MPRLERVTPQQAGVGRKKHPNVGAGASAPQKITVRPLPKQRVKTVQPRSKPVFQAEGPKFYAKAFKRNKAFAKPGPYQTSLPHHQEHRFRSWIKKQAVPFDPGAKTTDYDMRGFFKETGGKWTGGHFPDTYKTPYDTTFSRESRYATKNNPFVWKGPKLVNKRTKRVIFSPK